MAWVQPFDMSWNNVLIDNMHAERTEEESFQHFMSGSWEVMDQYYEATDQTADQISKPTANN